MEPKTANTSLPASSPSEKEPSIIKSVFHSIFIETVKDFFGSIGGFFKRYLQHYKYCFVYLWRPTLRHKTLSAMDWKENCQQSFELSLLFLFAIIFMVKLEWIPPSSKDIMDMLNNDLHQMGVELLLFFGFAIAYFVSVILSILVGRLLRLIFKVPISGRENDILFTYLNNVVFSVVLILSFLFRCSFSQFSLGEEQQDIFVGIWFILFLLLLPLLIIWSIRYCKLNGMESGLTFLFTFISIFPLTLFFSYCGYLTVAILFNI